MSVCCPHSLNIFFSKTAWPIKVNFHMEPPWDGGTKVCSNSPGHMTKVTALPICGKNLKKVFFSRTKRQTTFKVGMQHRVLEYYQVYSNYDPELTLTYFTAMSNLVPCAFVWEKGKTMDFQKLMSSMMTEVTRSFC